MPRKDFAAPAARASQSKLGFRARRVTRSGLNRLSLEPLEQRLALTALPAGFTETLLTTNSNLSSPTAMEISPAGEVWVLEQSGNVKKVLNSGATFTAIDLNVDSAGERGLLGIAFDPSYDGAGANTDYVYLYYTKPRTSPTDPANNQLVRFTVNGAGGNAPTLTGELLIREFPPEDEDNNLGTDGDTNHNGGAIHFGPDGKLYVAIGDHNYDPPGAQQATQPAQQLNTPFGKMLRLNPNGSNPSDNPFYTGSTSDWQGSIWALGLRNPYTFAIDPADGRVFINDVGEGGWEEINAGEAGANFGWAGSNSPVWEGYENDGSPPPWTNYHDPIMAYNHSSDAPTPSGVDITGGVFYPANSSFGAAYAGKYFFADAGAGFIRYFDPDNPGTVATPDTSSGFASSLTTAGPVDLKVDSAGNLYYLARGGEVYRISYTDEYGPSTIANRQLFYNNSSFDGNNGAANAADEGAIAPGVVAYRPGDGLSGAQSVSSYTRGINGIIVDVSGNHGPLGLDDFTFRVGNNNSPQSWAAGPAPASIVVRAGEGVGGSDRVHLVWNDGAIVNTWLEMIVEGNDALGGFNTSTGLAASDVFFFGSKVGDSGSSPGVTTFDTTTADAAQVFNALGGGQPVTAANDYNRDGQVSTSDAASVFSNLGSIIRLTIGAGGPFAPAADPAAATADSSRSAVAAALTIQARSGASLEHASPTAVPVNAATTASADLQSGTATQLAEYAEFDLQAHDLALSATTESALNEDLLDTLVTGLLG